MPAENSKQADTIKAFHTLHSSGCFILPNPWDVGTALYLQDLGFHALATTSAGFAFSRGLPDGAVPCDEMLDHIREIAAVASVPLNADFLSGFADDAEGVAINVARCIATGVAGLSIEDSTGDRSHPLFAKDVALSRVKAARESINASGIPVLLTGRCEAFLVEQPDPLAFVLDRLVAYSEAGADCLYAPGLNKPEEIAAVVRAVAPKPVNVLVSGFNSHLSLAQLTDLGVRRISVGSGLALAAWGEFTRAARDILASGHFQSLAGGATSAELNGLFGEREFFAR
ncbi:MAG TPA: isocitrate lyase/phosphoenolpyruvate mutase family protein [Chthoniobacterales bacterium]|jgi:methylisocitrate lyase